MRRLLKSKRGIALENAIVMLLVVFSFCTLLVSFALIGHYQVTHQGNMLERNVALDQIGQNYLQAVTEEKAGEFFDNFQSDEFIASAVDDALVVTRANGRGGTLLYVDAEWVDGNLVVHKWCYGDPPGSNS